MSRAVRSALAFLAMAVVLAGCAEAPGDGAGYFAPAGACVVPLSCDQAPAYPYAAHPFYGYFTPYASHIHIDVYNGRPAPLYRPYAAPIMPGYRAPAPAPAPAAARPAAPAAAKPAAPAPRPAAPAPRPAAPRAGK